MLRTSIFYSSVYDVALYAVHELLHHNLTLPHSSLAKVSYLTAFTVFVLASYELLRSFETLKNFDVRKLDKIMKFKDEAEKKIFDMDLDIKKRFESLKIREAF
jgi:hypothetical protein